MGPERTFDLALVGSNRSGSRQYDCGSNLDEHDGGRAEDHWPWSSSPSEAHTLGVSMYVDLMLRAMEVGSDDLIEEKPLIEYVRSCRVALLARGVGAGASSMDALAAELAYDTSLVRLADRRGIEIAIGNFAFPHFERERLELELMGQGINLSAVP